MYIAQRFVCLLLLNTVFALAFGEDADVGLSSESTELLQGQRSELLKLAPFRLSYRVNRKLGELTLPEITGSLILAADGRFLIREVTAKSEESKVESKQLFAWDGQRLFASRNPGWTRFLSQPDFAKYAEPGDIRNIPVVDMYSRAGAIGDYKSPLSYDGTGVRVAGLHVFDYLALYDMYYSVHAGKMPPTRWCDVVDEKFFNLGASMVSGIKERGKFAYLAFRPVEGAPLRCKSGYYMQMKFGKHPSRPSLSRALEVTHRGHWLGVVQTSSVPEFSAEQFNEETASRGINIKFSYDNNFADGWLPVSVEQTAYSMRGRASHADLAVTNLRFHKDAKAIQKVEWEATEFDRLNPSEIQAIFDQFVMMQKVLIEVSEK